MSYPKYESYKDSGIDWLGEIPEDWNCYRLKNTILSCINGVWGKEPNGIEDIIVLRVADFNRNSLRVVNSNLTLRAISTTERQGKILNKGDLLIEKSGGGDKTLVGCVVYFDQNYSAVTSNFIAKLVIKSEYVSSFINYVFHVFYENKINFKSIKQTTGIQNLDISAYLNEKFNFPSIQTQALIVQFLDQKTAQLDEAIRIKEKQIGLLKEQKQIMIQNAVTKGLDPNVKMKDSGVDWIGEIPEHWDVKRAKYLFDEIDERSLSGEEELLSVSHMTGVTPRSEKNVSMFMSEDYSGSKLCKNDDLIINIMWAWMGALGVSEYCGIVSPSYAVFRQKKNAFHSFYLESLLKSSKYIEHYNQVSTGLHSSRLRFYGHMFLDMFIGFPSYAEQQKIVDYLSEQLDNFENTIGLLSQQIDKLKEYKTTLINSAVTGKIKVTPEMVGAKENEISNIDQ